jgi:hypothetical protein
MTVAALALLAVALGLAWWVVRRATVLRREAELREARVLDALFAARQAADRGANIDLERIFAGKAGPQAEAGAEAALQAEVAVLLNMPSTGRSAAQTPSASWPGVPPSGQADRAAPADGAEQATAPPPVRDLVQVFYEARGFRPAPAGPSAQPIEAVLAHAADGQRAYAFAPLAAPPSAAALRSIVERARSLGQKRVLISIEAGPAAEQPAHGVRLLDRAAIETRLARLDTATAERIRARASQRAGQRLQAG